MIIRNQPTHSETHHQRGTIAKLVKRFETRKKKARKLYEILAWVYEMEQRIIRISLLLLLDF